MLELEYEFREQDLIYFNEFRIKKDRDIQKKIRQNRWMVPGVLLFIGMFYYYYYVDRMAILYIAVLAIIWIIAAPFFMKIDMRRQFFKHYTKEEKKALFGIHSLKIEPEFLQEKSPGGKHNTPWKEMLRVEKHKDYVLLYVDLTSAIVIPRETVKKGDLNAFAKQVESMIERLG